MAHIQNDLIAQFGDIDWLSAMEISQALFGNYYRTGYEQSVTQLLERINDFYHATDSKTQQVLAELLVICQRMRSLRFGEEHFKLGGRKAILLFILKEKFGGKQVKTQK